jgi:uridylate kinase
MKRLLLKISGEFFSGSDAIPTELSISERIEDFALQIKTLQKKYHLGIVMGGGNLVRGKELSKRLHISDHTAHQCGMLATIINGLCLHDLLLQHGVKARICSALDMPYIADTIRHDRIENAFEENNIMIFTGGTGQPFLSTDTAAIVYALRMHADAIWKCTKVDGIYNKDPLMYPDAHRYAHISHQEIVQQNLQIMDLSAIALAQQHNLCIRVLSMHHKDTLLRADQDQTYGSWIAPESHIKNTI